MAIKKESKEKVVVIKKPIKQKIIVAQGKSLGSELIPFKILHSEVVLSEDIAKERVKELRKEFEKTESISISYFSL